MKKIINEKNFSLWSTVLIVNMILLPLVSLLFIPYMGFFTLIIIAIILSASIIPVIISNSKMRRKTKNLLGYGIPSFLIISFIYFVYDFYTCSGKFCETGSFAFGFPLGLSAVMFLSFYLMGTSGKTNRKISILAQLSIIVVPFLLYFLFSF